MKYLLFCGAGNSLAQGEVKARYGTSKEAFPNIFELDFPTDNEAISFSSKLGSSLKLAKLQVGYSTDPEYFSGLIKSKNFSICRLGGSGSDQKENQDVKNILNRGRFVLSSDSYGLSPIILSKHKVDELFLDTESDSVWQTIWVHDYNNWIKKDRFMPHVNAKAGMLPPKIARSMINLAPDFVWGEGKTLGDPFCGSGRVLVESAELGFKVVGADILESQCGQTKENLAFLGHKGDIYCLDSTHLSTKFKNEIDLIVTEPFMGKPNPRPDKIKYLVPGLEKLYLGCLKNWHQSLKGNGIVIMVFPWFNDGQKDYKTSKIIDEKLSLSYNQLNQGIIYSRPGADVKREIVILQKK